MTTEAKAPDALLPCAHCGGDAHIGTTRYSRPLDNTWWADGSPIEEAFFAHCAKCAIGQRNSIAGGYQSANEAAEKWNRRAGQSHADAALLWALPPAIVECPRCHEQCGWCSDYRWMHGTMRLPGSRKRCTISGMEPEGDKCPVCAGTMKAVRHTHYMQASDAIISAKKGD